MHDIRLNTLPTRPSPRPVDCNKGDFGAVAIIGGAPGMVGAVLLAARAALFCGAGRVYAVVLDTRIGLDPTVPELMVAHPDILPLLPLLPHPACRVVGPGLGQSAAAHAALLAVVAMDQPLLLDADALNLIAADPALRERVRARGAPTVLTPHPGEAGRLLGMSSQAVQLDRPGSVARLSESFRAVVVLKGAGTLVKAPAGEIWRNTSGNPGMAAPGMGDVLAGIIAALIAQGMTVEAAAVVGVWLHGAAADMAVEEGLGPRGLTASELPPRVRRLLNSA
ncbi:MAG: NAD(P)H-hydrate dehydratase [Pseudomonadota bacterium]|nr:NAD(P)H-hydrate dehydratase [Pseudomonadota bacterium]